MNYEIVSSYKDDEEGRKVNHSLFVGDIIVKQKLYIDCNDLKIEGETWMSFPDSMPMAERIRRIAGSELFGGGINLSEQAIDILNQSKLQTKT